MKIGLINLPLDANYGGNLQRFALCVILQKLGHEVIHINLQRKWSLKWYKAPFYIAKRILLKCVFKRNIYVFAEKVYQENYNKQINLIQPFYDKYIKQTPPIFSDKDIKRFSSFDCFIVGSDQVWRKSIAKPYPLKMYFLDFAKTNSKKIGYSVSLGIDKNELTPSEIESLGSLYRAFSAVSVRESSALKLFTEYGWKEPTPQQLVDPTLLLKKEDYINLIDSSTRKSDGNLFCYILDMSIEKRNAIDNLSAALNMRPFFITPNSVKIEQWLKAFVDAEYVVTDSYHGFVFSMIFNKPVKLLFNEFRGNARFESLLSLLEISLDQNVFDWDTINSIIDEERKKSLDFLTRALNN